MADDDDDEVYIDVVARLDEASADEVEARLRDKLKGAAQDLGQEISDVLKDNTDLGRELAQGVSDKLQDVLGNVKGGGVLGDILDRMADQVGKEGDWGEKLANSIWPQLEKGLNKGLDALGGLPGGGVFTDILGRMADQVGKEGDWGEKLANSIWPQLEKGLNGALDSVEDHLGIKLGDLTGKALGAADAFKALKGGDIAGALQGANQVTGGAFQSIFDAQHQLEQTAVNTDELLGLFGGGAIGSRVIPKLLGPAGTVAGSLSLVPGVENYIESHSDWAQQNMPDTDNWNWLKAPFRQMGGYIMHPSRLGESGLYDKNGNYIGPGSGAHAPASTPDTGTLGTAAATPGLYPAMPSGGKTTANIAEVQANAAQVTAGSVTVGGSISLPASALAGLSAAGASAGGSHGSPSSSTAGTAGATAPPKTTGGGSALGNAGRGFASGGVIPGDSPGYDNILGLLPDGDAVGLEGGEGVVKPEAMQTPGVADIVKNLNKHYSVGGEVPGAPPPPPPPQPAQAAEGEPPTGVDRLINGTGKPGGVKNAPGGPDEEHPEGQPGQPGKPAQLGKKQETPGKVIDPHGEGQGFSIQGGLIGAAEQAGVMAAGMTPAGPGGSMAAQVAMQELNNAIGYAGKVGSILAVELPLDELGLNDSRYSNLAKSWIGKIGLGLVGGHNDTDNIAGQTHAPLTPQKDQSQSPLGGQSPQGQGGLTVNIQNQHNASDVDMNKNWNTIRAQADASYPISGR